MMDYPQIVKVDLDDLYELVRDSIILNRIYMDHDWNLEATGIDNLQDESYYANVDDDEIAEYIDNLIVR